jgi:DNA repair photolyase
METKLEKYKRLVAVGWTLTGVDSAEPNASPNAERIEAMRKLHEAGFKVWASIEPIIDFDSSLTMIC